MNTLTRYPEVSVGRELLGVARAVFSDPREQILVDNGYPENPLAWHGKNHFSPQLKIISKGLHKVREAGIRLDNAIMIIIEDSVESELFVEADSADNLQADPFSLDFVEAFRQYEPSPLVINPVDLGAAIKLVERSKQ